MPSQNEPPSHPMLSRKTDYIPFHLKVEGTHPYPVSPDRPPTIYIAPILGDK